MANNDKTEKPTPKRIRESRRKGQIAKSQDLTGWVSLLVGVYLVPWTVARVAQIPTDSFAAIRSNDQPLDAAMAVTMLGATLRDSMFAIAPLLAAVSVVSVFLTMGQVGFLLTFKPLVPDFKRVSPSKGFKRLFSMRSIWETVKQSGKVALLLFITWPGVRRLAEALLGNGRLPLDEGLRVAGEEILGIVRTIAWTMVVLSVADYGYQKYQHNRDIKMSKQEIKDEFRNTEGDAMVKGRIRSLQRAFARNRMLAAIGDADVIVTNPTHVAVALKYDPSVSRAPIVVATGVDAIAAKIRQLGTEHHVPIVEAKPLARALWRACDPGDPVPIPTYEAVAQVLAFIRRLDRRYALGPQLHLPAHVQLGVEALEQVPRKRRRR